MAIKNIVTGFINLLTGKETPNEQVRLKKCMECTYLKKSKVCGKCGCYVPAKVKDPNSKCPLKKW